MIDCQTDERNEYLQYLIDSGRLDDHERGITARVIAGKPLSDKQEFVFKRHVQEAFLEMTCRICGGDVAMRDLISHEDDGLCGDCSHSYASWTKHD